MATLKYMLDTRVCFRFKREPRCCSKFRQTRRSAQPRVNPWQAVQQRMAKFWAQPEGTGQIFRAAALFVVHLQLANLSPHALPRRKICLRRGHV